MLVYCFSIEIDVSLAPSMVVDSIGLCHRLVREKRLSKTSIDHSFFSHANRTQAKPIVAAANRDKNA